MVTKSTVVTRVSSVYLSGGNTSVIGEYVFLVD
jgi:hypothetical protein